MLYSKTLHIPNNKLPIDTIAQLELGRGLEDGNLDQLFRDDIEKFIEYNLVDVELVVDLDKKLQFIDLPYFIFFLTFSMRISILIEMVRRLFYIP